MSRVGSPGAGGPPQMPSPVQGEGAPALQAKVLRGPVVHAALGGLRQLTRDEFLQFATAAGRVGGLGEKPEVAHRRFEGALRDVGGLVQRGLVTEDEWLSLRGARDTLEQLWGLFRPEITSQLPPPLRRQLWNNLHEPIEVLRGQLEASDRALYTQLSERDLPALGERLSRAQEKVPTYRTLDLAALDGTALNAPERYQPGDVVPVAQAEGGYRTGIVVGREPDGRVRAASLDEQGALSLSPVPDEVLRRLPLKPGDHIPDAPRKGMWDAGADGATREVWVTGVDAQGQLTGVAQDTRDGPVYALDGRALQEVAQALEARRPAVSATAGTTARGQAQPSGAGASPASQAASQSAAQGGGEGARRGDTVAVTLPTLGTQPSGSPDDDALARALETARTARPHPSLNAAERASQSTEVRPERAAVLLAGGPCDVAGVSGLRTGGAGAALFTHKGVGYFDYNEDAAVVGVLPSATGGAPLVYGGVFDQAGGHGKLEGEVGAASQRAASGLVQSVARAAGGAVLEPEQVLRQAVQLGQEAVTEANGLLRQQHLEKGGEERSAPSMATTFAAGILQGDTAHVINVGDSEILHVSAGGALRHAAETHNFGEQFRANRADPNVGLDYAHLITQALGQEEALEPAYAAWKVEKGDWLVFVSDGVADSNLKQHKRDVREDRPWETRSNSEVTREVLARIVAGADTPEEATARIRDYTLAQMTNGAGKPDNVSVVVMRVE